ncbi:MAG TPA: hypothetical protein VHJ18_21040 [Streptosporangiaceae bacterium]|jgi:hypothetical protein|nr:hypothetical protein [Streptosporangiaceae bacterium]
MSTQRRGLVCVLVVLCGAAIIAGTRLGWVTAGGRRPASGIIDTSLTSLQHWSYVASSSYFTSFSFAILVAGAFVVLAGVLAARFLAGLFSFIALAGAGLWIGLNATHFSPISLTSSDLRIGAWLTIAGGLVGLVSSLFLRAQFS